ncbi:MAG: MFS transporter [Pirellulales bacterium]
MSQPLAPMPAPASRREIFAWAMYDWANSAYTTLSITVLMLYIKGVVVAKDTAAAAALQGVANALHIDVQPDKLGAATFAWGIGISTLCAALLSPIVGAMADARANKRWWLAGTALGGATCGVLLGVVPLSSWLLVLLLFFLASLLFELSFGFYNGFLPELATEETMDKVSAYGFALGYVGGGLALGIEFLVFTFGPALGLPDPVDQLRVGLIIMGLWWGIFALPAVFWLRDRGVPRGERKPLPRAAAQAIGEVRRTLSNVRLYRTLALFLLGFLFYNDGIQTVISQSSVFAQDEIGFTTPELLTVILAFQFICLPGAMIVSRVVLLLGQKRTLMMCLAIWLAAIGSAYFVTTKWQFWMLSVVLGLVMGGTQSVARAMMALMTPKSRTAEFFGFFNFSGRATSWLGAMLFGAVILRTGSARLAILSLLVLFVIGLLITLPVNVAQGQREAAE